MEWTISIIVLSLWLFGVVMPYTLNGHIHILLPLALAIVVVPVFYRAMRK